MSREHDLAWYEIWGREIIDEPIDVTGVKNYLADAAEIIANAFEDTAIVWPRWTHIDENNAIEWLGTRWVDGVRGARCGMAPSTQGAARDDHHQHRT